MGNLLFEWGALRFSVGRCPPYPLGYGPAGISGYNRLIHIEMQNALCTGWHIEMLLMELVLLCQHTQCVQNGFFGMFVELLVLLHT